LGNDELPMPVRIMALADTFDAMTSARPYREPLSLGSALSDLVRMTPKIRSQRGAGPADPGAARRRGQQSNSAARPITWR
jgi:hypothetical protein